MVSFTSPLRDGTPCLSLEQEPEEEIIMIMNGIAVLTQLSYAYKQISTLPSAGISRLRSGMSSHDSQVLWPSVLK